MGMIPHEIESERGTVQVELSAAVELHRQRSNLYEDFSICENPNHKSHYPPRHLNFSFVIKPAFIFAIDPTVTGNNIDKRLRTECIKKLKD